MTRTSAAALLLAAVLFHPAAVSAENAVPDISDFIGAEVDKASAAVDTEVMLTLRVPTECGFGGILSSQYETREADSNLTEFYLPQAPQAGVQRLTLQPVSSKYSGRMTQAHPAINQKEPQRASTERRYLRETRYALKLKEPGSIAIGPFKVTCRGRVYLTPVRQVRVSGGDEELFKPVALQAISGPPAGGGPAGPLDAPGAEQSPAIPPPPSAAAAPPAAWPKAEEEDGDKTRFIAICAVLLIAVVVLAFIISSAFKRLQKSAPTTAHSSPGDRSRPSLPTSLPGPQSMPQSGPKPGPRIIGGKYEVLQKLGEGGMGTVLLAQDTRLMRKVAVKELRPEIRTSPKECRRFLDEARIVAKLRHPYIVGIHDIVEEEGQVFLILDYVPGKALSSIIEEKRRLGLPACKQLFLYICEAIDFAHRNKILHRDLKPGNIMVNSEGFAMVTDFGLAREAKNTICRLTHVDKSGSPHYMAPEQHLGEVSTSSDIYALGVMLYEMATGEFPFQGPDFLVQKERLTYAPPSSRLPELPARLDELIRTTLAVDPKDRPESALAFLQKLKEV